MIDFIDVFKQFICFQMVNSMKCSIFNYNLIDQPLFRFKLQFSYTKLQMELRNMSVSAVVAFILLLSSVSASKSYPVTTLLNAKYNVTPVCLEIAEYLFDENPNLYWDYAENLNNLKTPLHEIGTCIFDLPLKIDVTGY